MSELKRCSLAILFFGTIVLILTGLTLNENVEKKHQLNFLINNLDKFLKENDYHVKILYLYSQIEGSVKQNHLSHYVIVEGEITGERQRMFNNNHLLPLPDEIWTINRDNQNLYFIANVGVGYHLLKTGKKNERPQQ